MVIFRAPVPHPTTSQSKCFSSHVVTTMIYLYSFYKIGAIPFYLDRFFKIFNFSDVSSHNDVSNLYGYSIDT